LQAAARGCGDPSKGCLKWGVTQVIIQVIGDDQWVFPMLWGTPIFGNLHIQPQAEGILPPALLLDGASQLRSARLTQRNWGQIRGQHEGIQPTKCWDIYSISKERTQMMMDLLNNNCIRPTAFKTTPTKDAELTPKN